MNLEKLFESLDKKVFTPEMQTELTEAFDTAVELKSIELSEAKIDAEVEKLNEEAEATKAELLKEAEEKEAELLENVDAFLEKTVSEFVNEVKETLTESLKSEKADLMVEAFDAMLIAGGVEVSKIVEAKDSTEAETKLAESVEKYDTLIEANIALEKENEDLIKMGVIAEMQKDLSIVEADKFAKLADLVEFSKDGAYAEKLETIVESVKGSKEVKDENLNEDKKDNNKSYSHLV